MRITRHGRFGSPLLLRAKRIDLGDDNEERSEEYGPPPPPAEGNPGTILLPDGITMDDVMAGEAEPDWIFAGPVDNLFCHIIAVILPLADRARVSACVYIL